MPTVRQMHLLRSNAIVYILSITSFACGGGWNIVSNTLITLVQVLKVLGDLLGHFSPPSPDSGQESGPKTEPGLLDPFLAGSTKSAPNHLAGPTKIPLPKNPPGRVSMELLMQCNFFQCYLVNSICRGEDKCDISYTYDDEDDHIIWF